MISPPRGGLCRKGHTPAPLCHVATIDTLIYLINFVKYFQVPFGGSWARLRPVDTPAGLCYNLASMDNYRFITKAAFKDLVEGLIRSRRVYGKVKKDGFPAFGEIKDFSELDLLQTPTHLSAKKYFFPQKETLLEYDAETEEYTHVVRAEEQAIVGLHACDIHALSLMDKVWSYGTPDPNYLAKREKTLVIGTECMPDEYCFCSSLDNMEADSGFDLFVHPLKRGYLARTGSAPGERLLKKIKSRPAKKSEVDELKLFTHEKEASFKTKLDIDHKHLPALYKKSGDSKEWERIGAICYGCGSCNNVCPTCYCFDVTEEVSPDMKGVKRVRTWDACTLEDFAKVAGGHNFRGPRAERLKHRFNRKFNYLSDKFDKLFCVGCGRCSRTCLVKINISRTTNVLVRESVEK